jgi:hypothetical protein
MKSICFSNNRTIRNGWIEHLVNFYNMLVNNPLCCKWVVALGPFITRGMHGLNLGWMIARCHKNNVIPIWVLQNIGGQDVMGPKHNTNNNSFTFFVPNVTKDLALHTILVVSKDITDWVVNEPIHLMPYNFFS